MRPLLRPGVPVLPRPDGWLQLGLEPDAAVLLPGSSGAAEVVGSLDGSEREDGPVLRQLDAAGVLVGEHAVLPLLADPLPGGPAALAALVRHRGEAAPDAVRRRRAIRLEPQAFSPAGEPGGPVDPLARLLDLAALAGLAGLAAHPPHAGTSVVGVLAGTGEPDRERVDAWTRDGTPHLVLRLSEGRAVVGPFVVPGETACLRCVDAHHTDVDPCWPLLVHQRASGPGRGRRPDGLPEPVDPVLLALAAAWAARDLASWADGVTPSTWSATLTLDAALTGVELRRWRRHPDCGCGWQ